MRISVRVYGKGVDQMQADGRHEAFRRVYDTYADMLYRLAVSMLRSPSDAEDAVQNAFCRYLDRAPDFRDSEHEKAWLLRVLINQCKDMMRRRKVRAWLPIEALTDIGVQAKSTPALDAVYTLPEKYKAVIILYHLEEMSIDEIAEALSLSPSAVKMRLSRGRDMLREALLKS